MTPLIRFHANLQSDHRSRFFYDYLCFSQYQLETVHDWVQWAFPNPTPSQYNPHAPVLTAKDIPFLRLTHNPMLAIYKDFLLERGKLDPHDHNVKRISRVHIYLQLIQPALAQPWWDFTRMLIDVDPN